MTIATPEKLTKPEAKVRRAEPFLLRSMGAYGYLKMPRQITERFNYDKDTVKDPEAFFYETDSEACLTFVFQKVSKDRLCDEAGRPSFRKATTEDTNGNVPSLEK